VDYPNRLNDDQAEALHRLMADGKDALNVAGEPANTAELVAIAVDGDIIEDGARTIHVIALNPDGTPEHPPRAWTIPPAGHAWPIDPDIQANA
jgi:hypothetical protein